MPVAVLEIGPSKESEMTLAGLISYVNLMFSYYGRLS
jgi:hypothetical protein